MSGPMSGAPLPPPPPLSNADQLVVTRGRHLRKPEIGAELFARIELGIGQHRLTVLVLAPRQPRERAFGEIAFGRLAFLAPPDALRARADLTSHC